MKKLTAMLIILLAAPATRSQTNEDASIISAISGMFDAMHRYDTAGMRKHFHPTARLQSATTDAATHGTRLHTESLDTFLTHVAALSKDNMKIEERLLSYEVKTDDPMASAWVPYEFYVNGKLSHTGVDVFQLFRTADGWKITYICDTRKRKKK